MPKTRKPVREDAAAKTGGIKVAGERPQQLAGRAHRSKSLVQFFRESPLMGVELDLEREKDTGRDIEFFHDT